ncbi:MAG TPA: hypothetical protein VNW15_00475 [Rhizomicrobium sp.]|nr:hypothetical protein [Rhizomicrobium sp.]
MIQDESANARLTMATQEIRVDLTYERHADGRYYVTSKDIPGFRMAGSDIDVIQADLNEVVSDLMRLNADFVVEEMHWVPSLEEVKKHLQKPGPEGRVTYILSGKLAA